MSERAIGKVISGRDLRVFVLLCTLVGGMGQGIVAPKLPELLRSSERLALTSGVSATLMYLGIFVSTFRYGRWADQGKAHWLLGPGLLVYAAILVGLGYAGSPAHVLALRFAEGLALSAVFVAADFVLGRLSAANERGRWLSYYGVALSIGLLAGPLTALLIGGAPIRALTVVAVAAAILGVAAAGKRVAPIKTEAPGAAGANPAALVAGAAYGFMEAGLVAVFPVLAVTEFHLRPELCLIVIVVAAAVSSVGWGVLSDKHGPRRVCLVLLTLLTFGALALGVFAGSGVAWSACVLFGVIAGGLYPVGFSWLLESLPESQYGYASGAFARAYGFGSLVGPVLCGFAVQEIGGRGLFWSMTLAGALGWGLAVKGPVRQPVSL